MNASIGRFRLAIVLAGVVVALAGCGGDRCAHDTCEAESGFDVVTDVPDTVVTGDAGDATGADTTRDDIVADAMADGFCRDPETGATGPCHDECWSCAGDWECESGLFCLTIPGYAGICTPICSTVADCPDSEQYTCTFWSDFGVCVPDVNKCPGCYAPTPFPLGDTCVECRDGLDCGDDGSCCDPELHVCMLINCAGGTIYRQDLCDCRQCFTNDDCLRFEDATGLCLPDGTCEGVVPCDGLCTESYPICAVVGGVEQCVECASDEDCVALGYEGCTCVGDPLYTCMDDTGAICHGESHVCGFCVDSGDCPPGPSGQALECVQVPAWGYGTCIDPAGSCDGVSSCCDAGQACYDLVVILQEIYPTVPRIIPHPDVTLTFCGCDTADDCLTGDLCTDLSILCTSGDFATEGLYEIICPDGQLHEAFPEKLCVQPATLLEYFGVVPAI